MSLLRPFLVAFASTLALLLAGGPATAASDPECLRRIATVAEALAAYDPPPAGALAGCQHMPEARLLLCLAAAAHGNAATADACPIALADTPLWAAEGHVASGARALRDAEPSKARDHFKAAVRADPTLGIARVGLVVAAHAAKKTPEARARARDLVAHPGLLRGPDDLDLHDVIRPAALALSAAVARIEPRCGECQGRLAYLHAREIETHHGPLDDRKWPPAVAALRVVLELAPADKDSRLTLGDTLFVLEDYQGAALLYETGLRLDSNWADGARFAGQAWLRLQRPEKALLYLEHAARLAPTDPMVWFHLGTARRQMGRKDAADAFRKAIAGEQYPISAMTSLGQVLLDQGDYAGARAQFEKVVMESGGQSEAHFGLARVLRTLGDTAGAAEATRGFDAALALEQKQMRENETRANHAHSLAAALDVLHTGDLVAARREVDPVAAEDAKGQKAAFLPFVRAALAVRQKRDPGADLVAVVELCVAAQNRKRVPGAPVESPP